jgi:hypothetical protein
MINQQLNKENWIYEEDRSIRRSIVYIIGHGWLRAGHYAYHSRSCRHHGPCRCCQKRI